MSSSNAIDLNSKACALMCESNFIVAASLLTRALREIQGAQKHDHDYDCSPCHDYSLSLKMNDLSIRPVRISPKQHDVSVFRIYNWALLITDMDVVVCSSDEIQLAARICAILMYNLGLCFQAIGMIEGSDKQVSFHKAIRAYDASSMLLQSSGCDQRLLRLAILNNKGCIMAYCYSDYSAAQECLGALQHLLRTVHCAEEVVGREDLMEIHLNVVLVYGRHAHASAA
ncbi:hypothetical protein MPSEU_000818900 [Mayamaea pseudoterrestris]|nr:hypothetical protein MPSEU_000818900 [Mayamaea pseudoterrestris]